MGRLLRTIVFILATLGIFYTFNAGCIDFLKWYISLQLLPQLFIGFAFGCVSWLTGKALNLLLLHWSYAQFATTTPGLVLPAALWLLHSALLFSKLKGGFFEFSWVSVSVVILAAELSVYPLITIFYQSKKVSKDNPVAACPSKKNFADITVLH